MLNQENPAELAFPLQLSNGQNLLTTRAEALAAAKDGLIENVACPFNGVLFHRQLVDRIGFSLGEMFSWGDEAEYTYRARRAGFPPSTCVNAIHFHPLNRMKQRSFRFFMKTYNVTHVGNPMRDYQIVRNYAYITHTYFGCWKALKHTGRYTLFYLLEFGIGAAICACRAGIEGMCGIFVIHQKHQAKGPRPC